MEILRTYEREIWKIIERNIEDLSEKLKGAAGRVHKQWSLHPKARKLPAELNFLQRNTLVCPLYIALHYITLVRPLFHLYITFYITVHYFAMHYVTLVRPLLH